MDLIKRLEEIPYTALTLEDRLRAAVGRTGADATTARVRAFIDGYRERQAELALLTLSVTDSAQLQEDISHINVHVGALRDDIRIGASALDFVWLSVVGRALRRLSI